jgi:hypothetical protein
MAFQSELPPRAKMLWAHVLRRAVFDFVLYKGVRKERRKWRCANRYIFSPGLRYTNGLSFEEVCDVLGWDPDYIRRLTKKLTRADIKKMATEELKEEFNQNILNSCPADLLRWKKVRSSLPIYARMVDEFTPIGDTEVVWQETLSRAAPVVRWEALA